MREQNKMTGERKQTSAPQRVNELASESVASAPLAQRLQRIERAAAANKPAPENLNPPETMLYYMLMGVYAAYQSGRITKEQGHEKKVRVYAVYKRMAAEYSQFTEICCEYQKRLREGYGIGDKAIIEEVKP